MFSTPSPADAALVASPDVQALLRKLEGTGVSQAGAASCAPCAALITPDIPEARKPCRGFSSWLLIILLLVGVFLVVYGVCQMFAAPQAGTRRGKIHGAPHMLGAAAQGMPAGAAFQGQPATGAAAGASAGDSLEETDPDKVVPEGGGVTFVFFHAPWCGHCKQFKPIFEALAKRMGPGGAAKFKAVQSDVLQASKHADKVPIRGFPTVVAFKNGQQTDSLVGNQGADALETFYRKNAAS
jgi:thiol-disulfide isomerase/thioredoxin